MENVGFGKRAAASILDGLVFGIPLTLVGLLIFGKAVYHPAEGGYGPSQIFNIVAGLVYTLGMWTSSGATVGKKIMKIKIVKDNGEPLTFGTAFVRYLGYIISGIPCGLGFLWVLWDKEHKAWHDKISGTKVISAE